MAVMTSTPSALICFASLLAAALGCGHGRDDAATDAASLDAVGTEIRDLVVGLAAGRRTRSEELGHQEFILTYKSFEPIGPACLPAA